MLSSRAVRIVGMGLVGGGIGVRGVGASGEVAGVGFEPDAALGLAGPGGDVRVGHGALSVAVEGAEAGGQALDVPLQHVLVGGLLGGLPQPVDGQPQVGIGMGPGLLAQ